MKPERLLIAPEEAPDYQHHRLVLQVGHGRFAGEVEWLPIVDAYRTACIAPPPEVEAVFQSITGIGWELPSLPG